ncbi:hypothetical protein [Clostridium botulinum]|uniref:hypothetical protein n=1 Tax=Clostridium botulinum TaxID=1491 RepID=UPI00077437F6|nr:hypothetical protein [Clostridium botulinum]NFE93711.1 hypothetical protein [Clostridium botulinum]NFL38461.1 hypothetical protein [Clostridium botulinum]NFL65901.1 hypothetical protein [Clostridium botulinum]NFN08298.1 hypothetical protein [Clostridium botulinum]NFN24389.1 hypothetical protein [Clostridium botulinum]
MSIEIKGIDNLLKRLNKLSNLETKAAVEEVAKDMEKVIRDKAGTFSSKSDCVKACETRNYGNSCYIDVGLKNTEAPFEEWKELYYQNYGYDDYGWNFTGQYHITNNAMWFNEAVESIEKDCKKKLKEKIKKQIKECWNG